MPPEQPYLSQCPTCGAAIDVTSLEPFAKINCPECKASVRVRRKFDHFVILKQIGEGGMSRVFEAEDETLGRHVALKILNRTYSRDAQRMAQFQQEALITARVTHPNVIKLFSVGYDQGHFFIAMELVTGGSLEGRIKKDGIVPEKDALRIGRQVAEGLRAAHRMGLMHRDVKPANILFTEDGTAKVVDFGLSIFTDVEDKSTEIWATPFYVSPEKVIEHQEDFRGDLFSLGATIYHALTGKPPHKASSNNLQELRMVKCHRVALEESGTPFAPRTIHVVDKLCAFKPEDRPESYDAAVDELRLAEGLSDQNITGRMSMRRKIAVGTAAAMVIAFSIGWLARSLSSKPASTYASEPMGPGVLAGGSTTVSAGQKSVADRFLAARRTLFEGKFKEAEHQFEAILKDGAKQPTLNKTRYNAALCATIAGSKKRAMELFADMASDPGPAGEPMTAFYQKLGDTLGKHLGAPNKIASKLTFREDTEEVMGYLAHGLAQWQFGDLALGKAAMERFSNSKQSDPELTWIDDYRKLVAPFLADSKVVALLQKPDSDLSMTEAESMIAELEAARKTMATESRAVKLLDERITKLKGAVVASKRSAQNAILKEETRRREMEMDQLEHLFWQLPSMENGYDYSAAIKHIKNMDFKLPEVRAAVDTKLYLYTGASDFLTQLFADIKKSPRTFHVQRSESTPLDGQVVAASLDELSLSLGGRAPSVVPLKAVEPTSLIEMARSYCEEVSDTTERFHREELIILFATIEKVSDAAASLLGPLMDENPEFRSRWLRVQQTRS